MRLKVILASRVLVILCGAALTFSFDQQARAETAGKTTPGTCSVKALRRIKRKMSMKRIIKLCGEPEKDIGSGIHIYVYELADGSSVGFRFHTATRTRSNRHGEGGHSGTPSLT